jgi:2',3'-cyclic-nucleotide 2'-phosphodiesterase (5'-nucleotidase family)
MRRFFVSFLTVLTLFSCKGHWAVTHINTGNTMVVEQNRPDSLIESILKPFRDSIDHDMNKVVGFSATPLVHGKPESKLTNLVADILLEYAEDFCYRQHVGVKPDMAYVNYGGIRNSLPQGKITVGNVFELMPFENQLVVVKLSGDAVVKMAGRIARRGGEGVAGMKIGIKKGELTALTVNGNSVDPGKTYWVATSDYIADGGDQMNMFVSAERIGLRVKIRDVLIQSLSEKYKKDGVVDAKEDGRIYNEQ